MTQLRRRMQEDLRLRNFSECTVRHDTHTVAEFATYFHKSPDQLGCEHVRTFLLHLLNERKLAWGTIQGARSALKFLYMRTLKQTWFDQEIIKPKTVSADEFLRRFLIHVLPTGLVRIRHFGIFANRKRSASLLRCRFLLKAAAPPQQPPPAAQIKCPLCLEPMLVVERITSRQILSATTRPRFDSS